MTTSRNALVCPLCHRRDFRPLVAAADGVLPADMCVNCELGIERHTTPNPGNVYRREVYDTTRERGLGLGAWARFHHDVAIGYARIEQFTQVVAPRTQGSKIGTTWCDVGCGTAGVLVAARCKGWSVRGVELEESFAEEIHKITGVPMMTYVGFINHTDRNVDGLAGLCSGKYDVISFFDTLEHMFDPTHAIVISSRKLNVGGYLVIEVPDFDEVKHAGFTTWKHRKIAQEFTEHIWHFGEKAITQLLSTYAGNGNVVHIGRPVSGRLQVIWNKR